MSTGLVEPIVMRSSTDGLDYIDWICHEIAKAKPKHTKPTIFWCPRCKINLSYLTAFDHHYLYHDGEGPVTYRGVDI